MTNKGIPLRPKNEGNPDVSDIIEGIQKRLPRYLKGKVVPDLTDEEFQKLSRDSNGHLHGIQVKPIYNRFSDEQLNSLPQHDKDQIRYAMQLNLVR